MSGLLSHLPGITVSHWPACSALKTDVSFLFWLVFFEREQGGGKEGQREKEGETLKKADCMPSAEPSTGLDLTTLKS